MSRADGGARGGRPLRIVFSLLHAGYLRHYGEPVRLLAARGHAVHLVLQREEKDPGDALLLEQLLADCPSVTTSPAPVRSWADGWRRLAWLVRALTDLARYMDPRFASASALKERMARKITLRVKSSRMDPVSKRLCTSFVEQLSSVSDATLVRRHLRRLALLEGAIPASREVIRFLRTVQPDAVLASPVVEIASPQVEIVKAARRRRIPSGVCIASWDNLTNKGLIRVLPDRVFVWNEIQRRELEEMHGVRAENVVITGAPKFDKWFAREPATRREEFLATAGLDTDRPFVAYLCSSPFIAPDEVSFVRRWLEAVRSTPALRGVGALVRPHPQNARQWAGVDLSGAGNVSIWPRGGEQPDAARASSTFFDTLYHSSAVVGLNTSALIEAAIAGSSVFTVLDPQFSGTQEGTLHFHYLLDENGGFLHRARDMTEHLAQIAAALDDPDADREKRRAFVERFCRPHGLDVAAAPLLADGVESLARMPRPSRLRPSPAAFVLRVLLTPVAFSTSLAAIASRTVRREGKGVRRRDPAAAIDV